MVMDFRFKSVNIGKVEFFSPLDGQTSPDRFESVVVKSEPCFSK
jgi:hypothetical protein